jgi:hypothetical protein
VYLVYLFGVGYLKALSVDKTIQSVPGGKANILGGHSIGHSKQKECICTGVLRFHTVHCADEQHAMSSHEFQSALMLTVEFSKIR